MRLGVLGRGVGDLNAPSQAQPSLGDTLTAGRATAQYNAGIVVSELSTFRTCVDFMMSVVVVAARATPLTLQIRASRRRSSTVAPLRRSRGSSTAPPSTSALPPLPPCLPLPVRPTILWTPSRTQRKTRTSKLCPPTHRAAHPVMIDIHLACRTFLDGCQINRCGISKRVQQLEMAVLFELDALQRDLSVHLTS